MTTVSVTVDTRTAVCTLANAYCTLVQTDSCDQPTHTQPTTAHLYSTHNRSKMTSATVSGIRRCWPRQCAWSPPSPLAAST